MTYFLWPFGLFCRGVWQGWRIWSARDEMHTVAHAFRTIFQASSKMEGGVYEYVPGRICHGFGDGVHADPHLKGSTALYRIDCARYIYLSPLRSNDSSVPHRMFPVEPWAYASRGRIGPKWEKIKTVHRIRVSLPRPPRAESA